MTTTPGKDTVAEVKNAKTDAAEAKPEPVVLTVEDGKLARSRDRADTAEILNSIQLIGRAVATIEPRFTARVLRTLTGLRKKLTRPALKAAIERAFPRGCEWSRH